MKVYAMDVFVTPWGTVRADDAPENVRSLLKSAPRRKDGRLDMRYKISGAANRLFESFATAQLGVQT